MWEKKTMETKDGLLITYGGKRYFVRPELLELCEVSEAELREAEKHKPLPTDPIVVLTAEGKELSLDQLAGAVGGTRTGTVQVSMMCPALF
jgi:hypothetical protein